MYFFLKNKTLISLVATLFFSIPGFAGWEVGDGAGGVNTDSGTGYMTFYSADIPVEIYPESPDAIPGLNYFVQKLAAAPLPPACLTAIYLNTYPSLQRRYFKAKDGPEFKEVKKRLIATYASITHIPAEHLVLFAVTDPDTSATLLFPEFYKLTDVEQAAILFHESLWAGKYSLNYESVMIAEQAAQAYFLNPNDKETYFRFFSTIHSVLPEHIGQYALLYSAMKFELDNKKMLLTDFLGHDLASSEDMPDYDYLDALTNQVMNQLKKTPDSLIWRALLDYASKQQFPENKIRFTDIRGRARLYKEALVVFTPNLEGRLLTLPLIDSNGHNIGFIAF